MIYDVFPFYNEVEILKIRLTELYDVVGQFCIVQSTVTHKGDPKPLYFEDNRSQFSDWSDKIRSIVINDMPMARSFNAEPANMFDDPAWKRELFQMDRAMQQINLGYTESVIYTDVDEIPLAWAVKEFKTSDHCVTLELPEHQYYLNWKRPTTQKDSCMAIGHWLNNKDRRTIRFSHGIGRNRSIPGAGWHFSSMGGGKMHASKLNSFCHWNRACILEATRRPDVEDFCVPKSDREARVNKVKIDGSFPKYVQEHIEELSAKEYIHLPPL